MFGVVEDLLTDLLRILVVEVTHLQLCIMAIIMESMETFFLLPLIIFPLLDQVSEEVSPWCFTVTRTLLH
jgi:hypothetical protein